MSRAIPADSSPSLDERCTFLKVGTIRNTIHAVFWGEADIDVGWECDLLLWARAQRRLGFLEQQLRAATGAQLAAVVWLTGPHGWKMPPDLSLVQCFLTFTSPVRASPGVLLTGGAFFGIWDCGQEVSPRGTQVTAS